MKQFLATSTALSTNCTGFFFSFSLDGKRNKKIKDKRIAPPFCPARPLFAGRSAGNYFIIPDVSSKVAAAEAWYAKTPEALCFAWFFRKLTGVDYRTKQGAGNIMITEAGGTIKK